VSLECLMEPEHERDTVAQVAHLSRVLQMLRGVNQLVLRASNPRDLLVEACEMAVTLGGYCAAVAVMREEGQTEIRPVASRGVDSVLTEKLCASVTAATRRPGSTISRVLRTGKPFVCNDTSDLESTVHLNLLMAHMGVASTVTLPLSIDDQLIGVFVLAAYDSGAVSNDEFRMLCDVSANLSFGLRFIRRDSTVQFLSCFDSQTGLAKRQLFCERLMTRFDHAPDRSREHAVVVIDIQHLSVINDTFGRSQVDGLLQRLAQRLVEVFHGDENVAHFNGGTFAGVIEADSSQPCEQLIERVVSLLNQAFDVERSEIPIRIRAGAAFFPRDAENASALVQNAEAALHDARVSGERCRQYSAQKHSETLGNLALEYKLRQALKAGQFEVRYQPKIGIVSGRVEGAEALLRWRDPELGYVKPQAFLPVLEQTGLISDIGDWVVRQVAHDCRRWLRAGLAPLRVAVNVSTAQLRNADFSARFLESAGTWPDLRWGIDVEITEGALHEHSVEEIRKLAELRDTGVQVSIDDFGTGYSSLARLAALPIDTLKIDRSFVSVLPGNQARHALVRTIVELATALSMSTVAEGVETNCQLEVLRRIGCHQFQGYLHSRPMRADELSSYLTRHR
jgi:diguanylate cyclase (GGDEF)-like protein